MFPQLSEAQQWLHEADFIAELLTIIQERVPMLQGLQHHESQFWVEWREDLARTKCSDVRALGLVAYRFCVELTPFITLESWDDDRARILDNLMHAQFLHQVKMEVLRVGLNYLNRNRMIDFAQCS
jgi:hypothetical protein